MANKIIHEFDLLNECTVVDHFYDDLIQLSAVLGVSIGVGSLICDLVAILWNAVLPVTVIAVGLEGGLKPRREKQLPRLRNGYRHITASQDRMRAVAIRSASILASTRQNLASSPQRYRNMQEREAAIGKIMASCRGYNREEVEYLLADWAGVKGLNFTDHVPDQEIDEIVEILREEEAFRDIAAQEHLSSIEALDR